MKFKLDENFGTRIIQVFQSKGHDAQTVRTQGLQGCTDERLFEICHTEQRCLVTLDLDFSDVTRFAPSSGIVVIRVSRNPTLALLTKLAEQFLGNLSQATLEKNLWIVEVGRIRIRESEDD